MMRTVIVGVGQAGRRTAEALAGDSRVTAVALDAAGCVRVAVLIDNGREATPLRKLIGSGRPSDIGRLRDPGMALRQLL